MKRLLSAVLVLVMVFAIIPLGVVMASAETLSGTTGDCTWTLVDGVLTISGNGAMEDYSGKSYSSGEEAAPCVAPWGADITEVIIEDGVTRIGTHAFQGCRKLNKVSIAESVTSIGRFAFEECGIYNDFGNTWDGDSDVLYIDNCLIVSYTWDEIYQIKEGTRLIADYAFAHSFDPVEIIIPDSVKYIGAGAFLGGKELKRIVIPYGITEIRDNTFNDCRKLEKIEFSDSVKSIGEKAFYNCSNLRLVKYNGNSIDKVSLPIEKGNSYLENARWVYSVKEELKQEADGKYYYYVDNIKTDYTGLVIIDNEVHYIEKGIWRNDLTTLVAFDGKGYYIKDGKWCKDTTLVKYKNGYSYVENGIWKNTETIVKYKGKWFYVKNGKWSKESTLVKYKGKWFYVKNGKWDNTIRTMTKYKGEWFFVKGGKWCKTVTYCTYKGVKYYIVNGKWCKKTFLIYVSGGRRLVNKGRVDYKVTGTKKIDGKTYKFKKGRVV